MKELIGAVGELSPKERKALAVLLKHKGINLFSVAPVFKRNASEPLLLSYAQERQWFLWQMDPHSTAYHISSALSLRGALDVAALERSFSTLIERHESLRTHFVQDGSQRLQVISPAAGASIDLHTLASAHAQQRDAQIKAFVEDETRQLFDLQQGPLLRVKLLRVSADEHVLVLTQHHIVSDGWSMQVMVDELVQCYAAYSEGRSVELAPLPVQYADYGLWQRQWMEAGELERQLGYWTERLGGEQPVLELPFDHPRPAEQSFRGNTHTLNLGAELVAGLKRLAQRENVTPFMLLLASFQVLLYRYSGQGDIRVGVPVANRNRAETERLIGFFVNTQIHKADVDGRTSFREFLQQVKQNAVGAQAHQDLPFEQLVEALRPERTLSHNPLFQVMFNHQSEDTRGRVEVTGQASRLEIERLSWETHTSQFDLTLNTVEHSEGLSAQLTYATDLFEPATVERMAGHWQALLQGIVAQPSRAIAELQMLDTVQLRTLLQDWNATKAAYPLDQSVQALIQAQVDATPQAIALVFAGRQLTYRQLDTLANQWAHRLIEAGVGPDVLVGVAVERSIEMVVGLLAVLKAGGAYVPLDPDYPEERLAYMIEDSGIGLLLTQQALRERLPIPAQVVCLLLDQPLAGYASTCPPISVQPENLAYVIYTSGSTGKPKGAGNRHSALTNRLCWMQQAYGLSEVDTVLQKTPFSFDVSVWEFFWPLMTGARLVVAAPGIHREPAKLIELINREHVTTLHFVPSMLQAFVADVAVNSCTGLQRIICSGEALPVDAQQQVFAKLPQARLYNLYGPTEAAIDVTHWTCREEGRDSVPIGQPIANLGTYILDAGLGPVAVGVVGELYLGGEGLARGYHRRPALTAERFVASPFGGGQRLYRTGDLARYRADGVIEYVGRIDHQVKIRGLRIELGEIEARLMEQDAVREAVVLAVDGASGLQLVGYVVPAQGDVAEASLREMLKARLREVLPDYMVPVHLLFLEQLPLSPNGKLERKALPKPDVRQAQQNFIAPQSPLEQQIAAIWQDVLKLERVGLSDNFFELGGDSIISIQVVGRARQAGIFFTPKELFQHQTVQGLAGVARIDAAGLEVEQGAVTGNLPLLPIHQGFFEEPIAERHHWNQSVLLKPTQVIEAALLEQALRALLVHHDSLRLVFSQGEEGWAATYRSVEALLQGRNVLQEVQLRDTQALQAFGEQLQQSLDLLNGPLLRVALVALADGSQRVLLVLHHLVVDGVSWRILFDDLQLAYRQVASGQALKLAPKTHSVRAWAEHLQAYAQRPEAQAEVQYWQQQLQDARPDLPVDHPGGGLQNKHGLTVHSQLSKELTQLLLQEAPAAYRTQVNDLLLTALARVMVRWTGHDQALIQLEGHGREDLFASIDLTRTVGWFTSLFAVKLTPAAGIGESIKQVKEQLRGVPQRGIGFGVLRYMGSPVHRKVLGQLPAPRVTFNYLGQFDGSFDVDAGALFVPSGESIGLEQSPQAPLGNWLTINGQVYGGQLSLNWVFSREMFNEATIEHLAQAYIAELQALVEHCSQSQNLGATPSDFALCTLTQQQLDSLPVPLEQVEDLYPLAPTQQGMLFHTLDPSAAHLYINQTCVPVEGLDVPAFIAAWDQVVARHEILRTGFWSSSDLREPLQVVYKTAQVSVQIVDWRDRQVDADALQALAQDDCAKGFDMLAAPLTRLTLVHLDEHRHQLIWTSHHILMDGWSNSRLMGEVFEVYAGRALPARKGHYRDYIAWLRQQSPDTASLFWKPQLQALEGPTSLAASIHPQPEPGLEGHAALYLNWDVSQTRRLREFAQHWRITPNTLIQAVWLLLLQRYTGQASVCFGATVAGRPASLPGADEMLGLFINTLPIVQQPDPAKALCQWLLELQALNLEVRDYEHAALADIQRWSGQGGTPLFDSIIVFENYPVDERLAEVGNQQLQFGQVSTRDVTNYAMDLAINLGQTLKIEFLYLRNAFTEQACDQVRRSFETLLLAMLDSPQARVGSLPTLACDEYAGLLAANPLRQVPATQPLLPQLIRQQAQARTEAVALVCDGVQLTYGQLEQRANRLAHYLIGLGVGPEVCVGVALQRSVEVIVAFYAVMKAGGAYVALDIDYPRERLDWIVKDANVSVLLTHSGVSEGFGALDATTRVLLDRVSLDSFPDACPPSRLQPDNLAYLIYTSGSTGQPKGVAVSHGPIGMHCAAIAERYEMDGATRELLFMSFAFDGAQERWLSTLRSGGCLVIRDNNLWTPQETWQALHEQRISIACFPPAYLQQLAEYAEGREAPPVQVYCFGGDAVAQASFELVKRTLKPRYLTNGYGPTETVVTPLLWKAAASETCDAVYAPIGSRVGERSLYVLDACLNPVPQGVAGELYIGGEGLARGYRQRPGMTAERFVADPFSTDGGRLYRTGDLVRQRADGVFDYLGRLDHQVKIRGFRIELGEIESRLRDMAEVRDAVVVARDTSAGKQLIGYVVADEHPALAERLRQDLQAQLPDYMVPSQILVVPAFPVSPNGKLDRKALPDPEFKGRHYVAPRTPVEQALAAIWQEVLEVEQVGVTDNFFELGGDSLRVLKVLGKVRGNTQLGLDLKLRDMMSKPTIAQLSGHEEVEAPLDPLLLLNSNVANRRPLFCLHAGFGTVFDYEPLARLLEGECSVYGVQCRMLLDRQWQDESLPAMAIDYAQYIRQKQAYGPYRLLGWSLGGPLALLVAKELQEQGEAVEFVGLVDSYMPTSTPATSDWRDDLQDFLTATLGQTWPQALPVTLQPAAVEMIINSLQAGQRAGGRYGQLEATDLAQAFMVGMQLKALAQAFSVLPWVAVDTCCWWGNGVGTLERQAFERLLPQLTGAEQIDAGHYDLLRNPLLLQRLAGLLHSAELIAD